MMLIYSVPVAVFLSAMARIVIYLLVLGTIPRIREQPAVLAVVAISVLIAVLTLLGQREYASLLSVPGACLVAWVCIQRVRLQPEAISVLLAAKEAEWSQKRHDLINDLAAEQARRMVAENELEKLRAG